METTPHCTIFTVGHSNRRIEDFLALLQAHAVDVLVDIRSLPRSRFNPHFNSETLKASLTGAGIDYIHLASLGGRRRPREGNDENAGWGNGGFRGYADYMQTEEFEAGLNELLAIARHRRTAIMCAESVPWKCHRQLVADALMLHDHQPGHIMGLQAATPHALTDFARIDAGHITYPAPQPEQATLMF